MKLFERLARAYGHLVVRGYAHLIVASMASFLAFYILFGVSIDAARGLILIGLLLAAAGWFFNVGTNRLWGKSTNDRD